ncbi:hypothetical protein [Nonomuraea helvata]|uniref:Uncharacterized protein n=1 Tax=Nonomuraea helvata TaxID=37484 RepID=A0ABV5RTK3_9ACTN
MARQSGGTFVLRVEDTDTARNRPKWTQGNHRRLGGDRDQHRRSGLRVPVFPVGQCRPAPESVLRLYRPAGRTTATALASSSRADRVRAPGGMTGSAVSGGWSTSGGGRCGSVRRMGGETVVEDLVRGQLIFPSSARASPDSMRS